MKTLSEKEDLLPNTKKPNIMVVNRGRTANDDFLLDRQDRGTEESKKY